MALASAQPEPGSALESAYLDLLRDILANGSDTQDRTGTGTRSVFGHQMRFDLDDGFPLVTTKKLHLRSIIHELLWFLAGDTNIGYLKENKVRIWDEWADENGDLGPVYGKQWRSFPKPDGGRVDQIAQLLDALRNNPHSRRHLVCAWNPGQLDEMALPPCHCLFQFYVAPPQTPGHDAKRLGPDHDATKPRLSCQLYQRSADVFLGVPFNIASYALLTLMLAQVTGMTPGEFIHTLGDAHLYHNHFDQAREQLAREPRDLPTMQLNPDVNDLFAFTFDDFTLKNYAPHPHIKAPVAV